MTSPDPWAVIEAVFPKAKPNPPDRPPVVLGSAAPDTTGYANTALQAEVQAVMSAAEGTRNHTLNRAAFNLGQLVAGGALDETDVVDALTTAGHAAGLDAVETRRTIASGLTGGAQSPRCVPPRPDVEDWLRTVPAVQSAAPAVDPETGEPAPKTLEQLQAEHHTRAVALALRDLRVKHEASQAHKAELAAATFREPPSVWTLAEELAIPDEPVTYAITEILPTGANALLAAQFKTGKTTFINNYARAFADGTPFLGRYTVNPAGGRIAIYNYELDPSMNRRWLREMNIANPERVVVLNLRGFRLPITAPPVEDWVVRWLTEREVTAWVVDPFARAAVGTDENSNTEVGVWLDTLDVIKNRAGVRDLVLPTHTGRAEQEQGSERARGATRLDDWADVRWLLTRDDDDNRFFRATGRDVDVPEEMLTFREENRDLTIGGGDRTWVRRRNAEDRAVEAVRSAPGQSGAAYAQALGGKKDAVYAALKSGVRARRLRIEPGAKNADLYFLTLTEESS